MGTVLYHIKNNTDRAFRFSTTVKFMPGETTVVNKVDYDAYPSIALLIKRGDLSMVGGQGEGKKKSKVVEEDVIEDA